MNAQIRRVATVVLVAFLALYAAPFYWQVVAAERLTTDPRNTRVLIKEYSIERGKIFVGQRAIASSVATQDALKYLRRYQEGPRWGHITGFYSHLFGRTLVEQEFNTYLVGQAPEQFAQNLGELLTGTDRPGGNVVLTVDERTQAAAERALGSQKGAVVALDYRTGAVLAMTTFPRYDPNQLAVHDGDRAEQAWRRLNDDPDKPLLNRASGETYPPGSTFKVVTAAAALENGRSPESGVDNSNPLSFDVPQTSADIRNFGGGTCFGGKNPVTLAEALEVSCNTVFARLGVELGAERLVATAQRFGLNADPGFQLPAATSRIPTELDVPESAQSAIGQRDVRVTPLQMASVAATIANGGERMAPYVVDRITDDRLRVIRQIRPRSLGRAVSTQAAEGVKSMMLRVVEQGTATRAQIAGLQVFGKTGTAQHARGQAPHVWFIGFASNGQRNIAVAVLLESGGGVGSEATGGRLAAPKGRAVIQAYLGAGG